MSKSEALRCLDIFTEKDEISAESFRTVYDLVPSFLNEGIE